MKLTRKRIALIVVAALIVALGADYVLYPRLATVREPGEERRMVGIPMPAVWMRYWWFTGDRSSEELEAELTKLWSHGIQQHYFCVGQIGPDGQLERGHPNAARVIRELYERQRHVDAADWIISPVAWVIVLNERAGGEVGIADPQVRATMVEEAVWLVEEAGFRGIQWDWEYAPGATDELIALVRETKEAVGESIPVSVTTPPWMPWPLQRWGWSEEDFTRIGAECDEIAVMCYDTGMYLPRAYVWLVRQQVVHVAEGLAHAPGRCRFRVGVPTYGDEGSLPSHHAHAENLRMALKGLREGCVALEKRNQGPAWQRVRSVGRGRLFGYFQGPAIFANWTTEEDEWETWDELWLEPMRWGNGDE
ncbi:MAG: hypothetical protein GF393_01230 [Armatimonadia bacterium]|nr:hypothetical protein [Armatimonadia bacterium]